MALPSRPLLLARRLVSGLLPVDLVADDAELLEELVAIDDDVATRQLGDLADLLLLQGLDELEVDVGVAGAAVEGRPLLADPLRLGRLLGEDGLRPLLALDEVGVGVALGLLEAALG